jgi:transcriptional regulator with GAF, ATPase, and Fis domain
MAERRIEAVAAPGGRKTPDTRTMETPRTARRRSHLLFQVHPLGPGGHPRCIFVDREVTVGREAGCRVVIEDDPLLSRAHAAFRPDPAGCVVEDLDSKNGVFVRGAKVGRWVLDDGDVVRLGGNLFVLREVDGSVPEPAGPEDGLIGFSPAFRVGVDQARKAAPLDCPVLVTGETGTGKELLAGLVHRRSGRTGPLVPVNCAAIAPSLFESALFGHRKGAFTGATSDFEGYAGAAARGTLFLDEIGDLPVEVQAKLLRFLETGESAAVGESRPKTSDVRVVAATNQDLERAVAAGRFRGDLYARLAYRRIELPPLRERPEDVLLIAAARLARSGTRLSPDAAEALLLHDWVYNVRELFAVLDGLSGDWAPGEPVPLSSLPPALRVRIENRPASPDAEVVGDPGSDDGRERLQEMLREESGNIAAVARRLGKDRRQVYRWIERLGLQRN